MGIIENSYSTFLKNIFRAANLIKKRVMKTECEVHKFINNQAIIILGNENRIKAYNLFSGYIDEINSGAEWADQDFKSSNHFYNPDLEKGLYGRSNAYREFMLYYTKAINKYFTGDIRTAMFYLGAACHLMQDMTVPQHANVKLLSHHRRYEQWVIKVYKKHEEFKTDKGGIYLDSPGEYIAYNSSRAISIYKKNIVEEDLHKRFYNITSEILLLAQRTTAGFMMKFYSDIQRIRPEKIKRQCRAFYNVINKPTN